MNAKPFLLKLGASAPLALLAALLGGADIWLMTLIGFTVADYGTGIIKAILTKTLRSGAAYKGGIRKILIYVIVGVAAALDKLLLEDAPILRSIAICYYIATEGLSILENIIQCGVPVPDKLRDVLQRLKNNSEEDKPS